MPALDHSGARDLLLRVVNKYYAERNSPLPGAFVKAEMLTLAKEEGSEFSERALGLRKFIEFIRTVPDVAIQGRAGSDILLACGFGRRQGKHHAIVHSSAGLGHAIEHAAATNYYAQRIDSV